MNPDADQTGVPMFALGATIEPVTSVESTVNVLFESNQ
jgi:hypothetical protein